MILEFHRQVQKVAAIPRQFGVDRKTVRKYIARGLAEICAPRRRPEMPRCMELSPDQSGHGPLIASVQHPKNGGSARAGSVQNKSQETGRFPKVV